MKEPTRVSTTKGLLAIIVVVAIGVAGYFGLIRSTERDASPAPLPQATTQESQTYTDTADTYTLSYPKSWQLDEADDCCEGEPTDSTKTPRSITITPPGTTESHRGVNVQADTTNYLQTSIHENWQYNQHEPQITELNGQTVEYVKVDFEGDAEDYTHHEYLISKGEASVFLSFREKYRNTSISMQWDNHAFLDEFNAIVNSVQLQ